MFRNPFNVNTPCAGPMRPAATTQFSIFNFQFSNFGEPTTTVRRSSLSKAPSPSPLPSPSGRGSHIGSPFDNASRLELLERGLWLPLSLRALREREREIGRAH